MGFTQLVSSYFRLENPFLWLHLFVWALAILVFRVLANRTAIYQRSAGHDGDLTEAELQARTFPLTSLEHHLELSAAAFVLIGLLGTMYSFIAAIPQLTSDEYDLRDFAYALSTSAFGIFWSLLLTCAVSVHRAFRIDPITEQLNKHVRMQRLAEILAQAIQTFGEKVVLNLRDSTEKFAHATTELAGGANSLARVSQATAESFSKGMQRSVSSAERLNTILDRMVDLPNQITDRLRDTFDSVTQSIADQNARLRKEEEERSKTAAAALSNSLAAAIAKFDALPDKIGAAVSEQSAGYQRALDELSKAAVERIAKMSDSIAQQNKKASDRELAAYQAALERSTAASLGEIRKTVEQLASTIAGLTTKVAQQMTASNTELAAALRAAEAARQSAESFRRPEEMPADFARRSSRGEGFGGDPRPRFDDAYPVPRPTLWQRVTRWGRG